MSVEATSADSAPEAVQVTLELPWRIVEHFRLLVGVGVYLSLEEALRLAVISSWRFERGSFVNLRLDLEEDRQRFSDREDQGGEDDNAPDLSENA